MKRLLLFLLIALSLRGQIQTFANGELNGSVRAKINGNFTYLNGRVCTAQAPAFSSTPTFDMAASPCVIKPGAMSADVVVQDFTHLTAGLKFSVTWTQPSSGGPYSVTYPGYVFGMCKIWGTANSTITQQFEVQPDGVNIKGTDCDGSDNLLEFLPVTLPSSGKPGSYLMGFDTVTHQLWCNYDNGGWVLCADGPTPLTPGAGSASLSAPRQYYVCTGTCTVTPPVPAAGYEFCIVNRNNVNTVITLAALGASARYENTARTAYGTAGTGTLVSGGAVGDKVCIVGLDSTHYMTLSFTGTWVAN